MRTGNPNWLLPHFGPLNMCCLMGQFGRAKSVNALLHSENEADGSIIVSESRRQAIRVNEGLAELKINVSVFDKSWVRSSHNVFLAFYAT